MRTGLATVFLVALLGACLPSSLQAGECNYAILRQNLSKEIKSARRDLDYQRKLLTEVEGKAKEAEAGFFALLRRFTASRPKIDPEVQYRASKVQSAEKWEEALLRIDGQLENIEKKGPQDPNHLHDIALLMDTMNSALKVPDVGFQLVPIECSALEVARKVERVLGAVQRGPLDLNSIMKTYPDFERRGGAKKLALALGIAPKYFEPHSYDPAQITELLNSAEKLARTLGREGRNLKEKIAEVRRALERTKTIEVVSNLVETFPTRNQVDSSLASPAVLPQKLKARLALQAENPKQGDLQTYLAGQYFLDQAVKGQPLNDKESAVARYYLEAQERARFEKVVPKGLPDPQISFLQAARDVLARTDAAKCQVLDDWVKFLNHSAAERLSEKDLALVAGLVGDATKDLVSQAEWQRVAYLTGKRSALTPKDKKFAGSIYSRIVKASGKPVNGLGSHLTGLLKGNWRKTIEKQRQDQANRIRAKYARKSAEPSKDQIAERLENAERLASYARTLKAEEDGGPLTIEKQVHRFYCDRLLWNAQEGGAKLEPEEKKRIQELHRQVALRERVELPAEAISLKRELKNLHAVFGSRPINDEILEDVLRFQLELGNGKIIQATSRILLSRLGDVEESQISKISVADGWYRDSVPLSSMVDPKHFSTDYAADATAWEKVADMKAGKSENPDLVDGTREFWWNMHANSGTYTHFDGRNSEIGAGDIRATLNTPTNGGPRTSEVFVQVPLPGRNGKTELRWIPAAGIEIEGRWENRDEIELGNGQKVSVLTYCAKCHMNARGEFSPTPDPARFKNTPKRLLDHDLDHWK